MSEQTVGHYGYHEVPAAPGQIGGKVVVSVESPPMGPAREGPTLAACAHCCIGTTWTACRV